MQPKILVIRLSSLGDIVLTGPVYKNLKALWPECAITVLVKPQFVPVLEGNPFVDEVLPFQGLWKTLRLIRKSGFTHLLDLHANVRSFFLRRLAAVPNTLSYRKDALARRLWVAMGRASPALTKHTIDRYLECLKTWDVPITQRNLEWGDYGARGENLPVPKHILLVQTAFLGDATLSLPLAREIKRIMPSSRLSVLCRHDLVEIYRASPWVDETIPDSKAYGLAGLSNFFKSAHALKTAGFDLAIVPHRSLRSALLVRMADIPRRIGFSNSAGRFLFTRTLPFTWGMHDLERNLGLLLPLRTHSQAHGDPRQRKASGQDSVYLSPKQSEESSVLRQRLQRAGITSQTRLIGIHPGSVWPTKRWPADRYAMMIRELAREPEVRIILVGGVKDAEISAAIATNCDAPVLDWTGKTTLAELISLMEHVSLFITNDSGPMHVATASGVPTLAIFGPTTRELGFFPYGPGHRVLEAELSCRPCGLHGSRQCPEGHFLCMRLITVDQVLRNAKEMLATKKETACCVTP